MLDVLEAALLARARPVAGLGLVHDASSRILRSAGAVSVASLTESAGVSSTHLAARFKHLVGITPKRLARTYRFVEVVTSIDPAGDVDWADVAHRAGYHDQPHFNHELRQFTGLTPTGYLGGWGGTPPGGDHCVVVSHRQAPDGWDPAAPFHFVDNMTDAVRRARELAGGKAVSIAAATNRRVKSRAAPVHTGPTIRCSCDDGVAGGGAADDGARGGRCHGAVPGSPGGAS